MPSFRVSMAEKNKGINKVFSKIYAPDEARAWEWARVQSEVYAKKFSVKVEKIKIKVEEAK